jgi:uncharacterized cupredoxin-like copper-binding protein
MLSTRRFAALLAIGAAVAVPIAGCGGDDNDNGGEENEATEAPTSGGAAATGPGGTVDLSATDFKFTPSDPTVKSGDVTFTVSNDGQAPHSLEIEDVNGEDAEIEEDISPGDSGTLEVNLKPGTYEFYCPVDDHKGLGMTGEITVK